MIDSVLGEKRAPRTLRPLLMFEKFRSSKRRIAVVTFAAAVVCAIDSPDAERVMQPYFETVVM
jgi:hypothetical protein